MDNEECVFVGRKFTVWTGTVDGRQREFVDHPGAVVILPFLDENTILLIQNERFAVEETLWELPAGTLEEGEDPIETAKRELIEETGYQAHKIIPLTTFYTTPGFCSEKMYVYLAENLEFVGQHLEDGEIITLHKMEKNQALQMVKDGTIKDGKTIAALLYAATFD